ncbi:MAG: hypothetical protein HY689_00235 [Chloroflexi bacterium]|nr:hypothetical protein [Chloroflexota bacterium]
MASWTAGADRATGFVVTSAVWNSYMGTAGNFEFLSVHDHSGAAGQGAGTITPYQATFTDISAPAAPGAGKTAIYTVSGVPHYRAGTAGADTVLADLTSAQTFTNKTLTTPTIGDFSNAQHDHSAAASGGAVFGSPQIVRKTSDETVNNSNTLQNDDELFHALAANEVWEFRCLILRSYTDGTPDIKVAFTVPTGATLTWRTVTRAAGSATTDETPVGASGSAASQESIVSPMLMVLEGLVINGANAGNLQLQWAQNTAHASDTKVLANSVLILHQLA